MFLLWISQLWSFSLSSYQEELEQRTLITIAELMEKDDHQNVLAHVEQFQLELFYSSKLYYETALLYNQKGDVEHAIFFYNTLLQRNPIHKAGLFDRAELLILQKQYALAWNDLQTLENNDPNHGLWVISLKQAEVSAYQEDEWNFEKYLMQSFEWGMDPYYLTTLGSNWYYWCRHNRLGPSLYSAMSDIEEKNIILQKICRSQ